MAYSPITTHVLNTALGTPAKNLPIKLCFMKPDSSWTIIKQGKTNDDGRLLNLITKEEFVPGSYKVIFDTEAYFKEMNTQTFYPYVEVVFKIVKTDEHYHVPLILSPHGYSTYRGS